MHAPSAEELAVHAVTVDTALRHHEEAPSRHTLNHIAGLILHELGRPILTDEQLTRLWVTLRLATPEIYRYAFTDNPFGCMLLFNIEGLDPTLNVPWEFLPDGLWAEPEYHTDEANLPFRDLQARLARLWAAAAERAKNL